MARVRCSLVCLPAERGQRNRCKEHHRPFPDGDAIRTEHKAESREGREAGDEPLAARNLLRVLAGTPAVAADDPDPAALVLTSLTDADTDSALVGAVIGAPLAVYLWALVAAAWRRGWRWSSVTTYAAWQ